MSDTTDPTPDTDPATEPEDATTEPDGATTEPDGASSEQDKKVPVGKSRRPPAESATTPGGRQISFTVTGRGLLRALAAVVGVALVVGIAWLGWSHHQQSGRLAAFDETKSASEKFVQTLVTTLNTDNAGNSKELLGPLSTGDLRKRLEQDRAATEQNVQSLKIEATSTIKSSSVQDFTTETAHTVVMAEVRGTSTNVPNGATNLMIFLLELRKVDGQWLVATVDGPPGSASGAVDPSQSLPGTGGAPSAAPGQPAPVPATPAPAPATPTG